MITSRTIRITEDMKKRAWTFASRIILGGNQYSRLCPEEFKNNPNKREEIEIQRTAIGKLGEIAFAEFLKLNNKKYEADDMFYIFEGEKNVDEFDFRTPTKKTIDVKSGFRKNHKNLLINISQFNNQPKDYYVAIWFNAKDKNFTQKIVDYSSITTGWVKGYAEYSFLKKNARIRDFGEGDAIYLPYANLLDISSLLDKFDNI